jgi:hypothetical protein
MPRCGRPKAALLDQKQSFRSTVDGIGNQAPVERRQLSGMGASERQQVAVGHLPRPEQAFRVDSLAVEQAHVVGPENVSRRCAQACHQLHDGDW